MGSDSGPRPAARAELAFEFAGRLQTELEALDWGQPVSSANRALNVPRLVKLTR